MSKRRIVLFVVAFFAVIGLLILSIQINNANKDIDLILQDGDDTNAINQVDVIDGEELFRLVEGRLRYGSLSEDLYYFGKVGYARYDDKSPMNFKIENQEKNGNTVVVTGRYGATGHKIVASFELLNNGKVASSITDDETALNIDAHLPSNSKRNQFIATLPIETNRFGIGYTSDKNIYTVSLYTDDVQAEQEAIKYIQDQSGESYIDTLNLRIITPSWVRGGIEE